MKSVQVGEHLVEFDADGTLRIASGKEQTPSDLDASNFAELDAILQSGIDKDMVWVAEDEGIARVIYGDEEIFVAYLEQFVHGFFRPYGIHVDEELR